MAERRTDKIGRAGEHYVAAELNRRGAHASPFSGNVPEIDIVATDDDGKRIAHIQVKTKRSPGNWHMGLKHGWASITLGGCPKDGSCGEECTPKLCDPIVGKENHGWVFVSLQKDGGQNYYIVPDDEVRRLVRENHKKYLDRYGGQRAGRNHDSLHHSISDKQLEGWRDKWSELGLGLSNEAK